MYDWVVLWEWVEIAVRWTHVITAVAWIGSSFYFIALDLGLRKTPSLPPLAHGEEWQVHGGGFYHIQKYLVAPEMMPEHLTWFKWESYATWLSGFAMLALVYYLGAELFLIDPNVMELEVWQAVAISLASLAFGWVVYNTLCRVFVNADQTLLMVALFGVLVAMAWFYTQVFSGRAALLHLGAFTASIMSGNVFFIIMPNQRIVVADLQAGRKPDAKYGKIAKQRSTHNNYLTLPVIFLMLSNHYPACLCQRLQLADRKPCVPDGRDHPALVQLDPCPQGPAPLDMGRDGDPVPADRMAVLPPRLCLRRGRGRDGPGGRALRGL